MRKVCAKIALKHLTQEQKENWKNVCSDNLECITEQLDVYESVITCYESWICQYYLEMKRHSMHLKTPTSLRMKKARMRKSQVKAMMIVFFEIGVKIIIEWVP
jgi:hypothetical protein